jgi:hypothetical protein
MDAMVVRTKQFRSHRADRSFIAWLGGGARDGSASFGAFSVAADVVTLSLPKVT